MKFLKIVPLTAGMLACCLVAAATMAQAQETAFLAAVRALAANPDQTAAAPLRMRAALLEWDRQISALEASPTQAGVAALERHLELGLAYRRRGRLDDALRQFDAAAALGVDASAGPGAGAGGVHLLRGLTLQAWRPPSGDPARDQEAGRAFQSAWRRDPDEPIKAYLAIQTADLGAADRAQAMDALRKAFARVLSGGQRPNVTPFPTLDLVPDTFSRTPIVGVGALAGVFAHLAAGQLDQAVAAFDLQGVPNTGGSSVPGAVDGALDRARTAEASGRLGDAVREYTTALTATLSGRHVLHVGIGRLAQVQGDSDTAIEAFSRAARLSPNDPIIRRELAAAYIAAGRADDAFAEFVVALLLAPEDAEALAAVGQLFLDTERAAEAIPVLRHVLAVRANRYQTHYALAVALSRAGRTEEAAREFERFDRLSREALATRRRSVAGEAGPPRPSLEPQ